MNDIDFEFQDAFEKYVAKNYEEVENFDHDYYFNVFVNVSYNSFNLVFN